MKIDITGGGSGIYAGNEDDYFLTITGSAISITGAYDGIYHWCKSGSVTITNSTVKIIDAENNGIELNTDGDGDITINGSNTVVDITAGEYGILTLRDSDKIIINGGTINSSGGVEGITSAHIEISGSSTKVTATGKSATEGIGISAWGEACLEIHGGSVIAIGGYRAIYLHGNDPEKITPPAAYWWRHGTAYDTPSGPFAAFPTTPYVWASTQKNVEITTVNPNFTVTVVDGTLQGGGTTGSFSAGQTVHIMANAPKDGEHFVKWTIVPNVTLKVGTLTNPDIEFIMPAANVTATAVFEADAPGEHSITVTHTGNGVANPSENSAVAGVVITIIATPDAGNRFVRWEVVSGGVTLSSTTATTATFTMPDTPVVINAVFAVADTTGKSPKTGENNSIPLLPIAFMLCVAGIIGMECYRKRYLKQNSK